MSIRDAVAVIVEANPCSARTMIATRYPFTYACDFVRENADELGLGAAARLGRKEIEMIVREHAASTGEPLEDVIVALADGYLAVRGFADEPELRAYRLRYVREHEWARLGLTGPVPMNLSTAPIGA